MKKYHPMISFRLSIKNLQVLLLIFIALNFIFAAELLLLGFKIGSTGLV